MAEKTNKQKKQNRTILQENMFEATKDLGPAWSGNYLKHNIRGRKKKKKKKRDGFRTFFFNLFAKNNKQKPPVFRRAKTAAVIGVKGNAAILARYGTKQTPPLIFLTF